MPVMQPASRRESSPVPPRDKRADFVSALRESLSDGSFVRLSLRAYKGAEANLKGLDMRPVLIKGASRLSLTSHFSTRDLIRNISPDDAEAETLQALAGGFGSARLLTTGFDLLLESHTGTPRLKRSAPSEKAPATLSHDRKKQRPIEASGKPYLHALGITSAEGRVLNEAQDKFRQINRYVEILGGLLKDLPAARTRRVLDMGSGKGYLTFALYDFLTTVLKRDARITGIEMRSELVSLCNGIAARSGFSGLDFAQGAIADFPGEGADVLIALHACDTATDDAIHAGISGGAALIAVAPCCHKQIRRDMERSGMPEDFEFLLRHGIFLERQAEMATDALRAMLLEYEGYSTKVLEFVSDAHTPKNVLIVGTKNPRLRRHDPAMLARIRAAKATLNISEHYLERRLGLIEAA